MRIILGTDIVRYPLTGVGRYARELSRHLQLEPALTSVRFLRDAKVSSELPGLSSEKDGHRRRVLRRLVAKQRSVLEVGRRWRDSRQSRALQRESAELFHSPNYYLPRFNGVSVVTFHDLSAFTWAHCHPPERVAVLRKAMEEALQRADLVITDSQFIAGELSSYFSYPTDKITSIPLASSAAFYPRSMTEIAPRLASLGVPAGGYCLYSGTIEPRKNLETLLAAYEGLPVALRHQYPLVICGFSGWRSATLHQRIERAASQGWVRYLGYLSSDDLPLIFAGARLFTFPSLYEGFGLPVLEAMASGIPVVCSSAASLPEVAGSVALMHVADDIEGLRDRLRQGLEDDNWRETAVTAGLRRSRQFSWQRCANETVKAYFSAVNSA